MWGKKFGIILGQKCYGNIILQIMKQLNHLVMELDAMNEEFKSKTNHPLFLKSDNKKTKVHKLWQKFGRTEFPAEGVNLQMKVPKLKHIAHKIVSSGEVPKCIIACTVARIQHSLQYNNWKKSASISLDIYINHRNENFKLFSFPEYSEKWKQLEPRTLDPMHILTNLRAHACRKGFDFCDKNSLLCVSEINSKLLPRPMVTEVLDQQNAKLAKRLFF